MPYGGYGLGRPGRAQTENIGTFSMKGADGHNIKKLWKYFKYYQLELPLIEWLSWACTMLRVLHILAYLNIQ